MAKTKISEFDSTPANNTDIDSINIAEGCAPSGINNAIRELMSQLKDQQTGASGDNFTVGGNLAVTGTTTFTGVPSAPTASAGTNTTQVATTAFVLANSNPTGGIMMWGTGTAPTGWLLCAGAAVSRSTYAALFAVIGTTFGVGDGSTTFNVPNYTNRTPYGTTVGATGGSADAVVVSHTHTATQTAHSHFIAGGSMSAALSSSNVLSSQVNVSTGLLPNENYEYSLVGGGTSATIGLTNSIDPAITVASAGVSGTNANLPPYLGINFIIKT
jgi:microcystin-dependent protein